MKVKKSVSFSRRLSNRLVLYSSILVFLIMLASTIISYVVLSKEVFKRMETVLDVNIRDIEKTLADAEMTIRTTEWVVDEHKNDPEAISTISWEVVESNPDIVGCAIAFRQNFFEGEYYFAPFTYRDKMTSGVVEVQLGNMNYDYFHMDWYQLPVLLQEPVWSEPYFDANGNEQFISTFSYPLFDEEGEVYAVITADISLEWLTKKVNSIKPYPNSVASLTSRCNSFVTTGDSNLFAGETIYSLLYQLKGYYKNFDRLAELVARGEKGSCTLWQGLKVSFVILGPLSNGWMLSMSCDYGDVLADAKRIVRILSLVALLALVLLFFICYYTIKKLTMPLTEFTETAKAIALGNFSTTIPEITDSGEEINKLRDSFKYMQKSIKDFIYELRESTASNERMESELSIASDIQQSMLAHNFPDNDDVQIDAFIRPAKEVGGDLYDFFIKDRVLYFAVGDVSGKGIPASLFMAITRYSFRYIANMGMSMDKVASTINNALAEGNESGLFVTLFVASLNLETGEFKYCNAGHDAPIVVGPSAKPYYLSVKPNLAVGLFEQFPYVMQETRLEKGSSLILYTDGVTEAERADYEQYGEERLIDWASTIDREASSAAVRESLFSDIKDFTRGNEQNDDVTIMVIKYK